MPLNQVIEDIEKEADPVLCVFDLDSTLFDVSPRTQHILRLFAETDPFSQKFSQQAEILRKITVESRDWGIKHALSRHKVEGPIDFFEAVREFWIERFFNGDYLHHDRPYEGAIDYVNELHRRGAKIIYLTGRDKKRMGEGTIKSLQQHKFPLDEDHQLLLKPHRNIKDSEFKAQVFEGLEKQHKTIWFFENEPVNINLIQQRFPQVKVIFMDSTHSGREQVDEAIPSISLEFPFKK